MQENIKDVIGRLITISDAIGIDLVFKEKNDCKSCPTTCGTFQSKNLREFFIEIFLEPCGCDYELIYLYLAHELGHALWHLEHPREWHLTCQKYGNPYKSKKLDAAISVHDNEQDAWGTAKFLLENAGYTNWDAYQSLMDGVLKRYISNVWNYG